MLWSYIAQAMDRIDTMCSAQLVHLRGSLDYRLRDFDRNQDGGCADHQFPSLNDTMITQTFSITLVASCALSQMSACPPPREAAEKLTRYLTYDNGWKRNIDERVHFRSFGSGSYTYFQRAVSPRGYDPEQRPVYAHTP